MRATAATTDEAMVPRQLPRVRELDGLRGLAVLTVVIFHAFGVLTPLGDQWLPNGFLGVDLFFVLSGFLITALLIGEHSRRDRIGLGRFYRRRAFRLLPALVLLLVAHGIYVLVQDQSRRDELESSVSILAYVTNWRLIGGGGVSRDLGHLWSLAVEEQFYLVWPILMLGLLAIVTTVRRVGVAMLILVGGIIGVVLLRIVLWNKGVENSRLYQGTDARADSLLVGALLAWLWCYDKLPKRALAVGATLALLVLGYLVTQPIGLQKPFFYVGGFTLVALACGVLIAAALESRWFGNMALRFAPLCAVGVVSYGLYLWHLPIFYFVAERTDHWDRWPRFVVAFAATAAITAASWFFVERPFLRWKSQLERRSDERDQATAVTTPSSPAARSETDRRRLERVE